MKSGNTLVTETAGHKEIFSVLGEADGASDTAVVSSGGLHQRRIGIRFGRDRGNSLHERIYVFSVFVNIDRIRHLRQHIKHAGVRFMEGKVPGAGTLRKNKTACGIHQLSRPAVELIDMDCIQPEVADEDLFKPGVADEDFAVRGEPGSSVFCRGR